MKYIALISVVFLVHGFLSEQFVASNDVGSGSFEEDSVILEYQDYNHHDLVKEVRQLGLAVNVLQHRLESSESQQKSQGRSYVHWGRKHCPGKDAKLVYSGYITGGYYNHAGSGRDYICTTDKPSFLPPAAGSAPLLAYMYGTEYEFSGVFKNDNVQGQDLKNLGAVCSVCEATGKDDVITVPGTDMCPYGWKVEYAGFLAANFYKSYGTNHICLDQAPEAITGSTHDFNGALLYPVFARCGTLPCPPYVDNKEVSCVVCSK